MFKNKILPAIAATGSCFAAFCLNAFAEADATAAPDANAPQKGGWQQYVIIAIYVVMLIALFYFLIIRPQKKKKKEDEAMKSSLCLGSEVVTIGGICGKVVNIKDDTITIQSSIDNTLVEFKDWAIREVKKEVTE